MRSAVCQPERMPTSRRIRRGPAPPETEVAGRLAPPYDAVLFDMDGVVLDSATLHAAAWKRLFDTVMTDLRLGTGAPPDPFDPETDYRRYVDGRAREDGVAAFLAARGVAIPAGDPADPPGAWTVHGLAARKNELFSDLVAERGVRAFPGSVALLRRLRAGGVPVALVTASRNADALLASAGLRDLFDVVVDGEVAGSLGLRGKPEPDMFLEAARRLGVPPGRTAVVEDAVAGVEAARRGRIGFVVGIDRGGNRALLEGAAPTSFSETSASSTSGPCGRIRGWSSTRGSIPPTRVIGRR